LKRLSTGFLGALMVACLGITAVAAPSGHASPRNTRNTAIAQATPSASPAASMAPSATPMASPSVTPAASPAPAQSAAPANVPPMQFGSAPSGEIPILFNDHHVYSKPDVLKQGRVLSALVRGGTILVPLRSMFEQMGATVAYDPASKTVDVTKPGSDVKVTLGRPEVTINGETRPLDVPPMMYQGTILVPVRVISEGMGAYVQWVPEKRLVVVRYVTATPPPPPPPSTPAPPAPTTAPTPAPTVFQDRFIAGDYLFTPKVYNEFNTGSANTSGSYAVRGALEFDLFHVPWMVEGDFRQFQYPHNTGPGPAVAPGTSPANIPCNGLPGGAPIGDPGCVTTIGGQTNVFIPAFTARESDIDARLGIRVLNPRIYIGVGYIWRSTNYGYPRQTGFGYGVEKLPDLNEAFSVYGSFWYYPNMKGNCDTVVCPTGPFELAYNMMKYAVGGTIRFAPGFPVFLDLGWLGDSGTNKSNAPANFTHNGPYVGLGIHF
jgi:Copper amine oxidase N-terminal domain